MSDVRHVYIMTLVDGQEAEYQRRHDEIWPEMQEALIRSGYRNYTLHRAGRTVVGVTDMIPSVEEVVARMKNEPITVRWNDSFRGIIEVNEDGEYGQNMHAIWCLKDEEAN